MRLGIEAWGQPGGQRHTGTGQHASHLLEQLPEVAPDLEIIAYGHAGEQRPCWLPESVEWQPVASPGPDKLRALISRALLLPGLARRDRLDLFHAPAVHLRPSMPPVPRLPCPTVVTLHDLIPRTFYGTSAMPLSWRLFYRWNLRRVLDAAGLITVSRHARDDIVRETGLAPERIAVIYNAVNFAPNYDRAPLHRHGIDAPYILYAGSYEPRKNLARALATYERLSRTGTEHQLVAIVEASSGHKAAIDAMLDSLHLGNRVRLLHSIPEADLHAIYTHADVLFFPSLAEGFGFPPVQAAACAVPAVVSNLEVLQEVLDGSAVYVDPRREDLMADGLRQVLSDGPLRSRLKQAGPGLAQRYQGKAAALRHAQIYRQAAKGRSVP